MRCVRCLQDPFWWSWLVYLSLVSVLMLVLMLVLVYCCWWDRRFRLLAVECHSTMWMHSPTGTCHNHQSCSADTYTIRSWTSHPCCIWCLGMWCKSLILFVWIALHQHIICSTIHQMACVAVVRNTGPCPALQPMPVRACCSHSSLLSKSSHMAYWLGLNSRPTGGL